jgi:DNA-binding response OmpR family regulator
MRVLVIDDDVLILKYIETALSSRGHEVTSVATAEAATARLLDLTMPAPEVALVDVNLPGLNGLEYGALLPEAFPGVKVVTMTGMQAEDDLVAVARAMGPVLLKPFTHHTLLDAIDAVHAN